MRGSISKISNNIFLELFEVIGEFQNASKHSLISSCTVAYPSLRCCCDETTEEAPWIYYSSKSKLLEVMRINYQRNVFKKYCLGTPFLTKCLECYLSISYHLVEQPHPRRFNSMVERPLRGASFQWLKLCSHWPMRSLNKNKDIHKYIHTYKHGDWQTNSAQRGWVGENIRCSHIVLCV